MKKTTMKMLGSLAIAAALAMTTGLTACSSENELTETPNPEQPAQPTGKGVKVTVTAGISDGATTRSAVTEGTDEQGKPTRTLKFTGPKGTEGDPDYEPGDRLYVRGFIGGVGAQAEKILSGFMAIDEQSIDGSGTAAEFTANYVSDGTGDLKAYVYDAGAGSYVATSHDFGEATDILAECQQVVMVLAHSGASFNVNYSSKNNLMAGSTVGEIATTVEELMTTSLTVRGMYDGQSHSVALATVDDEERCSPIFNCTLSGLKEYTTYQVDLILSDGTNETNHPFGSVMTDGSGDVSFACYMSGAEKTELTYKLRFTDNDNNINDLGLGKRTLASKVYNVTRHWTGVCFAKSVSGEVNLSTVTDNILAQNGTTLSGTLATGLKVSIAKGATVTFSGLDMKAPNNTTSSPYTGIDCLGDATINLVGTNSVKVENCDDAAIFVPEGSTLTIEGTGSLYAQGGTGAGIGGDEGRNCGNIVINGGTITAISDGYSAGIGSRNHKSCGDITINGGIVTAEGSQYAAGIGSGGGYGDGSSCGNITITGGTVTATGGEKAAGIGSGEHGSFNSITIGIGITSVTATAGAWNGYGISPKPIGYGNDDQSNPGTITISGDDLAGEKIKNGNVNDGDLFGEYGSDIQVTFSTQNYTNDTWTLTPLQYNDPNDD